MLFFSKITDINKLKLSKIVGRLSTLEFEFQVSAYAKKFDYVQVMHKDHGYVLCQIVELLRDFF